MRRWMALPVVAALSLAVACGGSSNSAKQTTGPSGSSGGGGGGLDTSHPFRIFSPIDRTGADAAIGTFWSTGLNAAVDTVNANGGILGRKVVVDYSDTQSNPQTATQVTTQALASGNYQALIPTAASTSSLPILQVVNRYKILTVGASGVLNMDDPKVYPTAFTTTVDQGVQGHATACLAMKYHPKSVAYLWVQDPTFEGNAAGMTSVWNKYGVKIVANESYPFAATDVTSQVQKIMQAHPDVLIIGAYFNALSAAIKAIDDLHYNVQLVGNAETSAAPPSSFLAASTPLPKNIVAMQWEINARINDQESAAQKKAAAAIGPKINDKYVAVVATYLYAYDALMYVKWAADTAKSDKTPDMVKALETLGSKTGVDTGGLIAANPGYTPTSHGLTSPLYNVDLHGKYVDGTFPTLDSSPIADCTA